MFKTFYGRELTFQLTSVRPPKENVWFNLMSFKEGQQSFLLLELVHLFSKVDAADLHSLHTITNGALIWNYVFQCERQLVRKLVYGSLTFLVCYWDFSIGAHSRLVTRQLCEKVDSACMCACASLHCYGHCLPSSHKNSCFLQCFSHSPGYFFTPYPDTDFTLTLLVFGFL